MPNKLAKLDDLKIAIGANTTGIDALLTSMLEDASAMAERLAGVTAGGLRRQVGILHAPVETYAHQCRIIWLDVRPVESITSVVQLYYTASDAAFDAATPMTELEDYVLKSQNRGSLLRLNAYWHVGARTLRIVYIGGYADPDDAVGGAAIEPPDDLQRGVIAQATSLYNQRTHAGLQTIDAGNKSKTTMVDPISPMLSMAASRMRRLI